MYSTLRLVALAVAIISPALAATSVTVGRVRVSALSPTLLRIEPKGPRGFEDRTTFVAVNRSAFGGIPVTARGSTVKTAHWTLQLTEAPRPPAPPGPAPICTAMLNTDLTGTARISACKESAASCLPIPATQAQCCGACVQKKNGCVAWIFEPAHGSCWLLKTAGGTKKAIDRNAGGAVTTSGGGPTGVSAKLSAPDGTLLWSTKDLSDVNQNLNWPAPTSNSSYALKDFPRFFVPEWGPTPIPAAQKANVDPALLATNGYDYRNNQDGDVYVWLLGRDLLSWHSARSEFVTLAGPTPVLPDFAFGTWFTWWHPYTEIEAKSEIEQWSNDSLPIDVWALDMNWRDSPHGHQPGYQNDWNHFYDHPNTLLFPDFAGPGTAWFDYVKSKKLRTYFNDHPFPTDNGTALQTSPDEVAFRWGGLSKWMAQGLTFWWFDANWGFSVPPPNVHYGGGGDGAAWDGMDNRVWGSHLYYTSNEVFNKLHPNRDHTMSQYRPMALTKYADANMNPGVVQHQHPAHHRYPVWWTGDGVDLEASVESMVDSGVADFKPYVHSDCGGDYRPKHGGDLLRWTAHCAFGTIHRFHGSDHRPWTYGPHVEDVIRQYLNMRYKLLPSFIAAGHHATVAGFPLAVRCDLFWPSHAEAKSNHQYLSLNDTLVAPIWDDHRGNGSNSSTRSVWVPPGSWMDAWSGAIIKGPKTISVTQPYEQQPMWHNHNGGLVVLTDKPGLRVEEGDWSSLTLEAFPSAGNKITHKSVFSRGHAKRTDLHFATDGRGGATLDVDAAEDGGARAWVLRLHLLPGQKVTAAFVDGAVLANVKHIAPRSTPHAAPHSGPFGGEGAADPSEAGHVAEVKLPSKAGARRVRVTIGTDGSIL